MKRVGLGRVINKMAAMFVPRSVKGKGDNKTDNSQKSNSIHDRKSQLHVKKVELRDERASASSNDCLQEKHMIGSGTAFLPTASAPTADDSSVIVQVKDNLDEGESDDEEIVSYSKNQRWPTPGEPVCVICGRYGAYIVDQTDRDVCSLECKARHLKSIVTKKAEELLDDRIDNRKINTNSNDGFLPNSMAPDNGFNFHYKEHPFIARISMSKVDGIRTNLKIKVKGDDISKPILEFQHCQLSETLNNNLTRFGYVTPTPVQMQVIPVGLSCRDVLACAQTGSGKTAAFLVPIIQRIYLEISKWISSTGIKYMSQSH